MNRALHRALLLALLLALSCSSAAGLFRQSQSAGSHRGLNKKQLASADVTPVQTAAASAGTAKDVSQTSHDIIDNESTGFLDCDDLYDHKPTWTIFLDNEDEVVVNRKSFQRGPGGLVTWCGWITGELGVVCITWTEGKCDADTFYLHATRGTKQGANGEVVTVVTGKGALDTSGRKLDSEDGGALPAVQVTRAQKTMMQRGMSVPAPTGSGAGRALSSRNANEQAAHDADVRAMAAHLSGSSAQDQPKRLRGSPPKGRHLVDEGVYIAPSGRRLDDGSNVDIAVVYTAAALASLGTEATMQSFITNQYATLNDAFLASQVGTQLTVKHMGQVDITEQYDMEVMLDILRDDVGPAILAAYSCDLIQLIVAPGDYSAGGIAYESSPQSLLNVDLFLNYVHIHEIGHNFGAGHDDENQTDGGYEGYGTAFKTCDTTPPVRTVDAYDCDPLLCYCERLPLFSSPYELEWNGWLVVLGTATDDNRRAVMAWKYQVANFQVSAGSTDTPIPTVAPTPPPGFDVWLIRTVYNDYCATYGYSADFGSNVYGTDCDGSSYQSWTWQDGEVRTLYDDTVCMALALDTYNVIMAPCDGSDAQRWDLDEQADKQYLVTSRYDPAGLLDYAWSDGYNGNIYYNPVNNGGSNQVWYFQSQ